MIRRGAASVYREVGDHGLYVHLRYDGVSTFLSGDKNPNRRDDQAEQSGLRASDLGRLGGGSVESFNGRFRGEVLNEHAFPTIFHARSTIEACRLDYNLRRPHTALGGLTPAELIEHYRITSNTVARGLTSGAA